MRSALLFAVGAFMLVPALAGGEECAHETSQRSALVIARAASEAACTDALAKAERTVSAIDGGVEIVFRSKDRKVLEEISQMAREGRLISIGGAAKDELRRYLRREWDTVTFRVIAAEPGQLQLVRSAAARLAGAEAECSEEKMAGATAAGGRG